MIFGRMNERPESICHFDRELSIPRSTSYYRGKVRDVYGLPNHRLLTVVSDRISAFDHILPRPIPFKGQVLNGVATHFLNATSAIVPNWLEYVPHPNVAIGKACVPIRLEMVVRGHLTGHAWRTYNQGGRVLCGVPLPEGLKEHDAFEKPIITPATKAETGHDEDISAEEILNQNIVTETQWQQLCEYSLALFSKGQEMAQERGLILVDTKYEFGIYEDSIILIDEIHTPDSSRYFYSDGFEERQSVGAPQKQLSKEFVREWLMENGFQGLEGQVMPEMTDDFVWEVSHRYQELYALITGETFIENPVEDLSASVQNAINGWLEGT